MMPRDRSRLMAGTALVVVLLTAGCFSSDLVAPNWLPRDSAHVRISGDYLTGESGSISRSDGIARMWAYDPNPARTPPFPGTRGLLLTWRPTGDSRPEPEELTVILPYELGPAPRTLSFTEADGPVLLLSGLAGVGANGTYFATSGTVTIKSATDSTITGTLDLRFTRGVFGANLRVTGAFNAIRCDNVTIKCNPNVVG